MTVEKSLRILSRWGIIAVGEELILAGYEGISTPRTSTAVVALDVSGGRALTRTGRPYVLSGSEDREAALAAFRSLWDAGDRDVRAVPAVTAAGMVAERPYEAPPLTPAEQRDLYELRLEHIRQQLGAAPEVEEPETGEDGHLDWRPDFGGKP